MELDKTSGPSHGIVTKLYTNSAWECKGLLGVQRSVGCKFQVLLNPCNSVDTGCFLNMAQTITSAYDFETKSKSGCLLSQINKFSWKEDGTLQFANCC